MRIAILGWGSLVWNPGDLEIEADWHTDGPLLPIKFARVSSGDRLTLVLVETSALMQPTLWTLSRKATAAEAAVDLRKREKTSSNRIGVWEGAAGLARATSPVERIIGAWATPRKLDAVVWTALGPRKPNGDDGLATDEELLAYLRGLVARGMAGSAREYFERTPPQVATPLRGRIRSELGWV